MSTQSPSSGSLKPNSPPPRQGINLRMLRLVSVLVGVLVVVVSIWLNPSALRPAETSATSAADSATFGLPSSIIVLLTIPLIFYSLWLVRKATRPANGAPARLVPAETPPDLANWIRPALLCAGMHLVLALVIASVALIVGIQNPANFFVFFGVLIPLLMALSLGFGIRTLLGARSQQRPAPTAISAPSPPSLFSALAALVLIGLLSNTVVLGGAMGLAALTLTDPQPLSILAVALWFLDLLAAIGLIWLWRRIQARAGAPQNQAVAG